MTPQDFIQSVSTLQPGGGTAAGEEARVYTVVGPTGATGPSVYIGDSPPSITSDAPMWFNTTDGNLYILFDGVYVGL